jgi:ribonucleases P/MRP protein subunit RPP40
VRGFTSATVNVMSGVPQGSHLGPLMFVAFINDLIYRLSCSALLYTDDLKIFTNVSDVTQSMALQSDLEVVSDWCTWNKMRLNIDKYCVISFTHKKSGLDRSYYIKGDILNRRQVVKDLGVLFDEKLSIRPHYESIVNKNHKLLGFIIRSTKDFKKASSTITLFYSLVRSVLEYYCPIWSPYYSVHINGIERAQKRCLWFLTRKFIMVAL